MLGNIFVSLLCLPQALYDVHAVAVYFDYYVLLMYACVYVEYSC